MSDIMYNKVPGYYKGSWEKYAIHNDKEIKGFFGNFRFLSNFYTLRTQIYYDGFKYNSTEHAFQAAKVDRNERAAFFNCSAAESKEIWKSLTKLYTPEQWDSIKYDIMAGVVFDKFLLNLDLRQQLLNTGDKYLEELNNWKDIYWGVDVKLGGENNLGKILMRVREFWK